MAEDFRAILNGVRISPRKAALVATVVRGKPVATAIDTLKLMTKKAAPLISQLIQSAMANATDRATVDVDRLIVSECYVNPGPTWKRFIPRAQGRAAPIRKRTANITVKLKEI
ncbi:MAG: 50S ribosomal protein L22 [Planctomycetota bacterium]|nr:50S ribosomal protein L22 [Planctomycetota bacterium]